MTSNILIKRGLLYLSFSSLIAELVGFALDWLFAYSIVCLIILPIFNL